MTYKNIILGGTFDHLHAGHKALIDRAFTLGERVWLGLTTDAYTQTSLAKMEKYPELIESFVEREKKLLEYLDTNGWRSRLTLIQLEDRFGTSLQNEALEAVVVSPETEPVAQEINQARLQKNWKPLEIIMVPWVLAQDGSPIHSTRIRGGEIDREGRVFSLPADWTVRVLPAALRKVLQAPLDTLIVEEDHDHESAIGHLIKKYLPTKALFIAVGDAVTDALLKAHVTPDISIVDLSIQRHIVYKNVTELGFRDIKVHKKADNKAGTLSIGAYDALKSLIHTEAKPSILQIIGEEDLLTLFAIILSPLNSLIVYGQPASPAGASDRGVVIVKSTEAKKRSVLQMLQQFAP